ncbi:hypothetical protein P3T76_004632 [Phytophthora citrophthora]|uniref:Carbohydrate esterase n=1 Tax=Phytophthora citrophthora TaxID=4793 RepID=A0AAD9LP57_9STRA|nr:hypothetical protein P3T76_004632 [Phytophthora citrophthora]
MFIAKFLVSLLALPVIVTTASERKFGPSETCTLDAISTPREDGSVHIYPGGNTRCAFDDYADNTTAFKTSSTYFFQVSPNLKQDKSKVLLYFQGGGACTDKFTCNFALQCQLGTDVLFTLAPTVDNIGILDRGADGNPFNDWNIVFLPYCIGDLFVGNSQLEAFESLYNQALGNKQCLGQNRTTHLNGYNNAKAVLDWAVEIFPNPEQLVIGGYSAGSAGSLAAQLWSSKVAEM